jgi:hypothetical protein
MTTRLGIELSPEACRIVEVEAGMAWHRHASDTRVRSFAVLPLSGAETRAKLESLRKQQAAVVVWNAPSEHRQVVVTGGSYEAMRAEALAALAAAGLRTRGAWADIAPASPPANRAARQSVVVAMAAAAEMSAALQPLIDAGIRVLTVTTPAMALGSLARLRRQLSKPDAIEAYVALEEKLTCIALMRGSVLIAAHELTWGYIDERQPGRQFRQRDDIAKRIGDAITDFIAGIGGSDTDIGQVCVCGGLPELRSMTAPLMERFDVEVEPLDSLFGIDAARLPEPVAEFRERGAELRLAWAVASDWPSPINLLRFRKRQASKAALARVAVATGMAAGLVLGWRIERSQIWRSIEPVAVARTPTNVPVRAAGAGRGASPAAVAASKPASAVPPVIVASNTPVVPPPAVVSNKSAVVAPRAEVSNKSPVAPPPAVVAGRPPITPPPVVVANKPRVAPTPASVASRVPVIAPPTVVAGKAPVAPPSAVVANKLSLAPPLVVANKPPFAPAPGMVTSKPPVVMASYALVTRLPAASPAPPATASRPPAVLPLSSLASRLPTAPTAPVLANLLGPAAPRQLEAPARTQAASSLAPPVAGDPAPREDRPQPATQVLTAGRPPTAPRAGRSPSEAGQEPLPRPARPAPPLEAALPFEAVLGTILYSPDRKLAIVDGGIVGPGDEVRGARIVEITPNAVILRDGRGRLWRLGLGVGVR